MQPRTQWTRAVRFILMRILALTMVATTLYTGGDVLVAPFAARAQAGPVDAKIEIVWPHDNAPVTAASLANIEVYLLQRGSLAPVAQEFDNPVRLWAALNADPASQVSTGQKTIVTRDGVTFPIWIFNDVDVSAAQNPANKLYFFARVDGVDSRTNVWTHGADPRTFFPQQDRPQATGNVTEADAKIEIVFPHDQAGIGGDVTAPLVNVTAMVFQHGTLTSATPDFPNTVTLSRSFNNGVQQPVANGTKRIVTDSAGLTFPVWDFNDVAVPFASDPGNKYYFSLTVDGLPTFPNIWSHGADALTFLPQRDVLGAGNVAPPVPTTGLRYGMQAEMRSQDRVQILNAIRGAGFRWVKQQVRWSELEPSPGQINFSELDAIANDAFRQRVNVLFSIVTTPTWARADGLVNGPPDDPSDFGRFVGALASRYSGRVLAYEIWNEQNLSREWAGEPINAGAYVELLKVAYNSIKQADPDTLVLTGALTPTGVNDPNIAMDDVAYLEQMYQYQNGIMKNFADGIGAHMAGYNNAPEDFVDFHTVDTPGFKEHGSFYFRRIDQLHDVIARNSDTRQMWITEYEWGAATPPVPAGFEWTTHLTEQQVADFFVRSIQMIQRDRPWVGAVFIWNLNFRVINPDFHTNEQAIFGILNPDFSPRLIYTALRDLPK